MITKILDFFYSPSNKMKIYVMQMVMQTDFVLN